MARLAADGIGRSADTRRMSGLLPGLIVATPLSVAIWAMIAIFVVHV